MNVDSECIEIYMENEIHINSELAFFEIEHSEGRLIIEENNTKFHNLFDFDFFNDFMDEIKESESFDSDKVIETLIDYANNDA
ncbi:hypothetical protein [Tenacibaculum holothuriorum]|uniref:hypothetical protein n=1 Tax=Tenacibaculum holothuriorum TaxID=1635173 RepID=UPI0018EA16D6|nr:hypothetical protein [Tenacibaculum holothuriorum]